MGRRKKLDQQKKTEKLTSSIRYVSGRVLWRPNPQDPYIYVSFDANQLKDAYGTDQAVSVGFFQAKQLRDFIPSVVEKFKAAISQEWITRAELPVKFLPPNISPESIRNKNVCFILSNPYTQLEEFQLKGRDTLTTTLHMRFPETWVDETTPSQYKVIMSARIANVKDITNEDIHLLLHESGHALAELKHFRQYGRMDVPPFIKLTCLDSVMGYEEDCPPVLKKSQELLPTEVSRADSNPEVQNRIRKVMNAYPAKLGPVDLEAAKEFVESWNSRNEAARKQQTVTKNKTKTAKNKNSKSSTVHEELYVSKIKIGGFVSNNETGMLDAMNQPQLSTGIMESKPYSATTAEFPSTSNQMFSSVSSNEVSAPELSSVEWLIFGQLVTYFALPYFSFSLSSLFSFISKLDITLPWNRVRPLSTEEEKLLQDYQSTLQAKQSIIDAQRKSRVGQYEEDFKTIDNLIAGINQVLVEGTITGADFSKIKTDMSKLDNIIHKNAERNKQLRQKEIETYRKTRRGQFWTVESCDTSEDEFCSESTFSPPK